MTDNTQLAKQRVTEEARRTALLAAASSVEPLRQTVDPDEIAAHAELILDLAWLLEGYAKSGIRDVTVPQKLRDRYDEAHRPGGGQPST